MEKEYSKLLEPHQTYLDSLDAEDKILTAIRFISENPDCGVDVVQMAVEIQHA